jgi:hypothetical protein
MRQLKDKQQFNAHGNCNDEVRQFLLMAMQQAEAAIKAAANGIHRC